MEDIIYDHYIAIDWSIKNMAIARMTAKSNKITIRDEPASVTELQAYFQNLKGTKVLTIEETTTAQWLYTELKDYVDKILICDPRRNRLLSEGPKTDKIDAAKLVQLLRSDLLKEVYHSGDRFLDLRKLVSGYEDLVKSGVRLKNQRYSLLRGSGLSGEEKKDKVQLSNLSAQIVLESLDRQIGIYEKEKQVYEKEFKNLAKRYSEIQQQKSLPGIGIIGAVKIVARIVSAHRFVNVGHFLSYAGLVKLERKSGTVIYGRKNSRYSREMKSVYKTGVMASLGGDNEINNCYEYLIREKGYASYNARHKACRRLATLSYGIFKSGKKYQPIRRQNIDDKCQKV
jgi:hypothetical protein